MQRGKKNMIKKINKYQKTSSKVINALLANKQKVLAVTGGLLLTTTFLSGCGSIQKESIDIDSDKVSIRGVKIEAEELGEFDSGIQEINIQGLGLKDISELSKYKNLKYVYLSDNYLEDVSALEGLPITSLYLYNNNIKSINLENFKDLEVLCVEGNYNLYTQEFLNSCKEKNIQVDFNEKDVQNVQAIKEMLKTLDFEGKTDFEKEQMICDFVCDHMKYDYDSFSKIISDNIPDDYDELDNAVKGKGVCASYAKLFTAMCQLSGINSYEKSGVCAALMPHAWSLVEIDGQYIYCDPTNFDSMPGYLDEYLLKNASGKNSSGFISINNGLVADIEMVKSSDPSKIPGYNEEKKEELMKLILSSVATGSAIFLSAAFAKKIRDKYEDMEYGEVPVEDKELGKARFDIMNTIYSYEPDKKTKDVLVETKDKISIEIELGKLPTEEEKISFLQAKSQEKLREAAILQVDTEYKDLSKEEKEEKITKAMSELVQLSLKDKETRALFRCKKSGEVPMDSKLEDVSEDIIYSKIEEYEKVDNKVKEFLRIYLRKLRLQSSLDRKEDIETISSMKSKI